MDEQNKNNVSQDKNMCGCPVCRGWGLGSNHHWGKYFLIKKLVMLIVLIIVFCVGVKVGEFKAMFRSFHHSTFHKSVMMDNGQDLFYYQR